MSEDHPDTIPAPPPDHLHEPVTHETVLAMMDPTERRLLALLPDYKQTELLDRMVRECQYQQLVALDHMAGGIIEPDRDQYGIAPDSPPSPEENAALDKCVRCSEGILSVKLGGMCGDCDPFAGPETLRDGEAGVLTSIGAGILDLDESWFAPLARKP